MMIYVIHCMDRAGGSALREANHAAHREHLARAPGKLLVAGPLVADDGQTAIGSLFIVDAESRAAVESFNADDPFMRVGLWDKVRIDAFAMRIDQR